MAARRLGVVVVVVGGGGVDSAAVDVVDVIVHFGAVGVGTFDFGVVGEEFHFQGQGQ